MLYFIVDFLTGRKGGKPVDSCGIARKPRPHRNVVRALKKSVEKEKAVNTILYIGYY